MTSPEEGTSSLGEVLRSIGAVLLVIGLTGALVLRFVPIQGEAGWIAIVVQPLTIIVGAFLLYRGKQYIARDKARAKIGDNRAPVVYLRPFLRDESMTPQVFASLLTAKALSGFVSVEEQLAEAVTPIGPLVAVGRPGESLPKPGATRAYASDAEWKEVVDRWLSTARLVILRPGSTEGILWEMQRALETVRPDRVLVLMVRTKRAEYESIATSLGTHFSIALPAFDEVRRWRRVSGLFEFGDEWKPHFLPLRAPYWRVGSYKATRQLLHHTLQPVFLRLGIAWEPLPVSTAKIAAVAMLGLIAPIVLIGLAILAANIGSAFLALLAGGGTGNEPPGTRTVDGPTPAPAIPWRVWTVAGLNISAPSSLGPESVRAVDEDRLRSRGVAERLESYTISGGPVLVQVSKTAFRPEVRLSLEGAARGAVSEMARAPGVGDFRTSTVKTSVSRHPGILTSATFTSGSKAQRVESLYLAVGQTLWQVHASFRDSADARDDADRILRSVVLAGPLPTANVVERSSSSGAEFVCREGGFAVSMPGHPNQTVTDFNAEVGVVAFHKFALKLGAFIYWAGYADFPMKGGAKQRLDDYRDGFAKGARAKVLSERTISLGGYVGREIQMEGPPGSGVMTMRIYWVEGRLFMVSIITGKNDASSQTVRNYVSSFRLLEPLFNRPPIRSRAYLSKVAGEINKDCPKRIDRDTELLTTLALDDVLVYQYRLVNLSAREVNVERLTADLRTSLKNAACSTPGTRDNFLSEGITLRYTYEDKDRTYLTSIDVTPGDCPSIIGP